MEHRNDTTSTLKEASQQESIPASEENSFIFRKIKNYVARLLKQNPKWQLPALIFLFLFIFLVLGVLGVVWVNSIPKIWHWSVDPFSKNLSLEWLKIIPGVFTILVVIGLSFLVLDFPVKLTGQVLDVMTEASEEQLTKKVDELSRGLSQAEADLEKEDRIGLVPIVRYSRTQLESYYKMGLTQTQRSFRYSILAMWFGFLVILAGLAYQILPSERLFPDVAFMKTDIKIAAIAGSTIIEIIAALFLWVYRSSISQLTYFYNRQLHIHNVIMCYRMASSMKEPDDTVRAIIDKVLERAWSVDRPETPSGKVLGELFSKKST